MIQPEVRRAAWQSRLSHPAWDAQPNAGHRALVALERSGRLHAVVTQNIDELHQRAGHDAAKVIEVHGTLRKVGPADVVAYGLFGIIGWTHRWFRPETSLVSAAEVGRTYAELLLGGITPA